MVTHKMNVLTQATGRTHSLRCFQIAVEGKATVPQPLELTELSTGLLQLLDLVLQDEHGYCESQQRQKLQLGRHHDSEQTHQIIQIGVWSVHAQRRGTLKTRAHTNGGSKRMSVCAWPFLRVWISPHSLNPWVTSNAMRACPAW